MFGCVVLRAALVFVDAHISNVVVATLIRCMQKRFVRINSRLCRCAVFCCIASTNTDR